MMLLCLRKCCALLSGLFSKVAGVCLGIMKCCLVLLGNWLFLIQASSVFAAVVFGAVVVKERMVFVPVPGKL